MSMNVRTLCLGILSLHEATGYEIRKMVEEGTFSHFIDASYGSIYPALAQLLKEGLVSVRTETAETVRPPRKVYTITEHRGRRWSRRWPPIRRATSSRASSSSRCCSWSA